MGSLRIFGHYVRFQIVLLALVELSILGGSIYTGALLRFEGGIVEAEQVYGGSLLPIALFFAAVMLTGIAAMGMYHPDQREGYLGLLLRAFAGVFLGALFIAVCFYIFPGLHLGRGVLALSAATSFLGIGLVRALSFTRAGERMFNRRVLVLGVGDQANTILRMRRRADWRGIELTGFIPMGEGSIQVPQDQVLHLSEPLSSYAIRHEIDQIVVALDDRRNNLPIAELVECKMSGAQVIDLVSFYEMQFRKLRLDLLLPSYFIFSEGFRSTTIYEKTKRCLDIVMAVVLLAVTWPIIVITALMIWVESGFRGPVFYRQVRVSQYGRFFSILKFRSMRADAEHGNGAQWATKNDTRVTRVGAVIRKLRIDEIPQVINILRGDMSFVGPRPERPEFVSKLAEKVPYYSERHRVKPGLSGWAQVCYPYGASESDAIEKLQYDLYYVKNNSIFLDLLIMIETLEVILFGKGAR